MKLASVMLVRLVLIVSCSLTLRGQIAASSSVVPRLVSFSARAIDATGKPIGGIAGVSFAIYKDQYEGAPLWMETQNVQADAKGNYSVQLGATKSEGLPLELFSSGEARWLGVRVDGGQEQPRVLLLSVPYALKAADAQTLGGLPASAFVLAPGSSTPSQASPSDSGSESVAPPVGGSGTQNYVPLWIDSTGDLGNSILYQVGSGSKARIGINEKSPLFTLDVNGQELVRGLFEMATQNYATPTKAYNSQPFNLESSAYNSGTSKYTLNHFQWQAEPTGNNTTTPAATLNLLYGTDPAAPAETGLQLSSKGIFTFAPGQTFPGGSGTVTSVALSAPMSDFTVSGSPVTTSGTLGLKWNVAPTNASTANAIVKRDANGDFQANSIYVAGVVEQEDGIESFGGPGSTTGVYGVGGGTAGTGVFGQGGTGVGALSDVATGVGVYASGGVTGVIGLGYAQGGYDSYGVYGAEAGGIAGVYGLGESGAVGVSGYTGSGITGNGDAVSAVTTGTGDGYYAYNHTPGAFAAFFDGNVDVDGILTKAAGAFKIDHPLDPANKYLYHSFVESPDMKNIYDGEAVLDANGEAVVNLPDWFETLNRDFRYQLTPVGAPGPNLYIAAKVHDTTFKIAGGQPGMEVSWQVTGIRQDAFANAHRIPLEEMKAERDRGLYMHPELFGAPPEQSISLARRPMVQKLLKEGSPPGLQL